MQHRGIAGTRMRSTSIRRTTVAVVLVLLALVLAFAGFANVMDALGGVTLDVEERMLYYAEDTVIDLKPGVQHLDGDKALQYARFRADGVGDFGSWGGEEHGRVASQKKLLKAVIAQTPSIRNAWRLPQKSSVLCRRQSAFLCHSREGGNVKHLPTTRMLDDDV